MFLNTEVKPNYKVASYIQSATYSMQRRHDTFFELSDFLHSCLLRRNNVVNFIMVQTPRS